MSPAKRGAGIGAAALALVYVFGYSGLVATEYRSVTADAPERFIPLPELDKADYDARMLALAHAAPIATSSEIAAASAAVFPTSTPRLWPVRAGYPNARAILPFKRIIAYYGNFYSKGKCMW